MMVNQTHILGVLLFLILAIFFLNFLATVKSPMLMLNAIPKIENMSTTAVAVNASSTRVRSVDQVSVFCWITTQEKALHNKLRAVNETWAKRCNNKIFIMTTTVSKSYPWKQIVDLNVPDGRPHLTEKSIGALKYIYKHHLKDYDWFLKADDDTYVVMENLKYLLSHYNPNEGIYLGHLFKKYSRHGYMSGGAGYVLSRQAVKQVVEQGFNTTRCSQTGTAEDVDMATCLHAVGIPVHNTLDYKGRQTFQPQSLSAYLYNKVAKGLSEWERHPVKTGVDCCSQLWITFHYMTPNDMRLVDFLLYKSSVFGKKTVTKPSGSFFQIGTVPPL